YSVWKRQKGAKIEQHSSMSYVLSKVNRRDHMASPVEKNDLRSPWIHGSPAVLAALSTMRGHGAYSRRKGVYCPTNGIYWLSDCQNGPGTSLIVTNLADTGKRKVRKVTMGVESTFVHSLLRGRDLQRWRWSTEMSIILPQQSLHPTKAVPET